MQHINSRFNLSLLATWPLVIFFNNILPNIKTVTMFIVSSFRTQIKISLSPYAINDTNQYILQKLLAWYRRNCLGMSTAFFWELAEIIKDQCLYYDNGQWISHFSPSYAKHFSQFHDFLDIEDANDDFPNKIGEQEALRKNLSDAKDWVADALHRFSDKARLVDNVSNTSHLGKVDWSAHRDEQGNLYVSSMKTCKWLLSCFTDLAGDVNIENQIKSHEDKLKRTLSGGNKADIAIARDQFNEQLSLHMPSIVKHIIEQAAALDETTIDLDDKSIYNEPLWVTPTDNLSHKLALMSPQKVIENARRHDSFYRLLEPGIRTLTGVHCVESKEVDNDPLYESFCVLNFRIPKSSDVAILKPGYFNGGCPRLWAYANAPDNAGRTVRLDNGKEGVPEGLVIFSEIMPFLDEKSSAKHVQFIPLELRALDKPSISNIRSHRVKELKNYEGNKGKKGVGK